MRELSLKPRSGSMPLSFSQLPCSGSVEHWQASVLTGRRRLSAIIATLVFIAVHALHFDWIQVVPIAPVATVLATLYLWRHDLWANIVAHIAVDSAGLVSLALQTHKLTH